MKLMWFWRTVVLSSVLLSSASIWAQELPKRTEGDFLVYNFHFRSGDVLPQMKLHYATDGKPVTDASGRVTNAVMVLHGTGGSGQQFTGERFAGVLFGSGQLLDANRYYIILPDSIGHRRSTKPSDGLHAKFPHYDYDDMVEAQHRLLTEGLKVDHMRADGHIDGLHALVGVDGNLSRFHGRSHAAGLLADTDRRPEPHDAQDDH